MIFADKNELFSRMPNAGNPVPRQVSDEHEALVREIASLVITALNLEVAPGDIDPAAPLYGEGLGLDSIDILEVALVISKRYGFKLRDDDQDNVRIFRSLDDLASHVADRAARWRPPRPSTRGRSWRSRRSRPWRSWRISPS